MPVFPLVFEHLQEDDSILGMFDNEYLEVRLSFEVEPKTDRDLLPSNALRRVAHFVKRLETNAEWLADNPCFPDGRDPNGHLQFKMNDDVIVGFQGNLPFYYWQQKDGSWELQRLRVFKKAETDDPPDLDEFIDSLELDAADEGQGESRPVDLGRWLRPIPKEGDAGELTPDPLFGVLQQFVQVLKEAHKQVDGTPLMPDSRNPNSEYRFRSDDEYVVAYRSFASGAHEPVWCWKRKPNGRWKLYKLHPVSDTMSG